MSSITNEQYEVRCASTVLGALFVRELAQGEDVLTKITVRAAGSHALALDPIQGWAGTNAVGFLFAEGDAAKFRALDQGLAEIAADGPDTVWEPAAPAWVLERHGIRKYELSFPVVALPAVIRVEGSDPGVLRDMAEADSMNAASRRQEALELLRQATVHELAADTKRHNARIIEEGLRAIAAATEIGVDLAHVGELDRLRAELAEKTSEISRLNVLITEKDVNLASRTAEIERLAAELEASRNECATAGAKIIRLTENCSTVNKANDAQAAQLREKSVQIDKLNRYFEAQGRRLTESQDELLRISRELAEKADLLQLLERQYRQQFNNMNIAALRKRARSAGLRVSAAVSGQDIINRLVAIHFTPESLAANAA